MRYRYNAVNFYQILTKNTPIYRPLGRGMGCNLWFDTLIYILLKSTQCCMKYHVILGRVKTALDYVCQTFCYNAVTWLIDRCDEGMGLLPGTSKCGLRMRRQFRERFPRHGGLAISTCITAHVRAVIHVGITNYRIPLNSVAGKTFPAFPAHAQTAILYKW